mmetsp:Transcript_34323/g.118320  ORF Transcript_34323/g.118320 Transcript_34323/m.118320 type:complete len:226 (-) Transcript_34323:3178-3855(-)
MTQAASRPWKRSIVDTSTSESNSASSAWMQRSCSRNGVSTTMSCGATPRRESSRTTAKTTFASAIFRVSPLPARAPPGASPGSAASGSTSRNDAGAAQAKRSHSGVEVEKPWIPSCVFPGLRMVKDRASERPLCGPHTSLRGPPCQSLCGSPISLPAPICPCADLLSRRRGSALRRLQRQRGPRHSLGAAGESARVDARPLATAGDDGAFDLWAGRFSVLLRNVR